MLKRIILGGLLIPLLSSCSWIYSSATDRFANSLSSAILNQNDPGIVQLGIPAYLLLLDGFIEAEPENSALMLTGSRLYSAYANAFVGGDLDRASKLTDKAWHYAQRALCENYPEDCGVYERGPAEYQDFLGRLGKSDLSLVYIFGTAWGSWIQAHRDNWSAVADIPKVTATMERVVEIDPKHQRGDAYISGCVVDHSSSCDGW